MIHVLLIVLGFASMAAIGFAAWKVLGAQEKDPKFEEKLREDDERARKAREGSGTP